MPMMPPQALSTRARRIGQLEAAARVTRVGGTLLDGGPAHWSTVHEAMKRGILAPAAVSAKSASLVAGFCHRLPISRTPSPIRCRGPECMRQACLRATWRRDTVTCGAWVEHLEPARRRTQPRDLSTSPQLLRSFGVGRDNSPQKQLRNGAEI
jgi:hypothetical protein